MTEYIVALNVSFTTPIDVNTKNETEAGRKAKAEFVKLFANFKKQLNDIADEAVDIEYIEAQD